MQRTQRSPKQGPNVVGWDESRPARTAGTLVVGTRGATALLLAASTRCGQEISIHSQRSRRRYPQHILTKLDLSNRSQIAVWITSRS